MKEPLRDSKGDFESESAFVNELIDIVETARDMSFRAANLMQVASNWLVGWRIVEQEQHGQRRAAYGKHIIEIASKAMTEKFGQGYSETTLRSYRKFYQEFPMLQIQQALPAEFNSKIEEIQRPLLAEFHMERNDSIAEALPLFPQLSWMHYERLMRVADKEARRWYMEESAREQWDYRTLRRNIDSQYYHRLLQTDMYLKMYDKFKQAKGDNPTIGIILCSETNADVAQYSSLATNKQMYASKYLTYMPSKEDLRREIERQKEIFRLQSGEE